jgi:hypothetical protein
MKITLSTLASLDTDATPPIYCVSAPGNEARRARMQERMAQVELSCEFLHAPLTAADVEKLVAATGQPKSDGLEYRTTAIMLDHLALIRRFVHETSASHVIVCEDDIYLRRTIKQDLPSIVREFDARELDVLLLGYLWPHREVDDVAVSGYRFCDYDDELWGSQMYLLSRRHATHLVETYTLAWAIANADAWADAWANSHASAHVDVKPFSPDWILTKVGRRARLYPMLAVEEGGTPTTHVNQIEVHRQCAEAQYDPALFV